MEDRKQNQGQVQGQGPGGAARQQKQDEAYQNFQGGGRTGTPVRPQSQSGQQQNQQQSSSGQSTGKEGESRRGADWDASRGQSGRTAAGEDTRPL
jgi:hypothetical protein